jgi:hypothetical protein
MPSFNEGFEAYQEEERKKRLHHALSAISNAEERICILIDEGEVDEAKEEVEALCKGVRKWLEDLSK